MDSGIALSFLQLHLLWQCFQNQINVFKTKSNQTEYFQQQNYLPSQMPNIVQTRSKDFVNRGPKNNKQLTSPQRSCDLRDHPDGRLRWGENSSVKLRTVVEKYQHSHEVSEYCKLLIINANHMSVCTFIIQSKNWTKHIVVFLECVQFSSHAMVKGCLWQNKKCIVSTIAAATLYQEHPNTFATIWHVTMRSNTKIQ